MRAKTLLINILGLLILFQMLNAQTWLSSKRITWNSEASITPAIAIDSGDTIHVLWNDSTPGNAEMYYKRSSDGGGTWSGASRLTWNSGDSFFPVVVVDSSNTLHVVWHDNTPGNSEVFYKRSTDGGGTWSGASRLSWNSGGSYFPAIAVDSSNKAYVVWSDWTPSNPEIFWKMSTDGGVSWSGSKRLTSNSAEASNPEIAVDSNNNTHVFWQDGALGLFEIYYKKSTDGGVTWSGVKRLTWNPGGSYHPTIGLDSSDTIHMVWQDGTPGNAEIYHKSSTDEGVSWSVAKRLTWTANGSFSPAIAVDSSNRIHVVLFDSTPGNDEIYYKRSTDGGVSWSSNRLTWNSGHSEFPSIAADSNDHLHLTWFDSTPGNFEIYYKKGIQ
jgi:hypothetical protein